MNSTLYGTMNVLLVENILQKCSLSAVQHSKLLSQRWYNTAKVLKIPFWVRETKPLLNLASRNHNLFKNKVTQSVGSYSSFHKYNASLCAKWMYPFFNKSLCGQFFSKFPTNSYSTIENKIEIRWILDLHDSILLCKYIEKGEKDWRKERQFSYRLTKFQQFHQTRKTVGHCKKNKLFHRVFLLPIICWVRAAFV